MSDPLIETLREKQERMERELGTLRRQVEGDTSLGYAGLKSRVDKLADEHREHGRMLGDLRESEERREKREEELVAAERKREDDRRKVYLALVMAIATGVIGIVINFLQTLVIST